jgi:FAD/FMN-containing dehydrogenase
MGNSHSTTIQKCLETALSNKKTLLATSSTLGYQHFHVKPYNLDIPVNPTAVTYPETAEQVAAIVKCAVDNALKVQPRSGGHSYANYGKDAI